MPEVGQSNEEGAVVAEMIRRLSRRLDRLEQPDATQLNRLLDRVVDFDAIALTATGFAAPSVWSTLLSGAIEIPAGSTSADLFAFGGLVAYNGTAIAGSLRARIGVGGVTSSSFSEGIDAGTARSVTPSAVVTLSGLVPGESIAVELQGLADSGWGSVPQNTAALDVLALFRR
jgi:hypothetical protein